MNVASAGSLETQLFEPLDQDHLACRMFVERRERRRFFGDAIFSEPAWDMLLALSCAAAKGLSINAHALTRMTGVSVSVAQRWLTVLEDAALVVRRKSPENMLFEAVELSETGCDKMDGYFSQIGSGP
jgi:DNA-binding MarR family transcriptional regulator